MPGNADGSRETWPSQRNYELPQKLTVWVEHCRWDEETVISATPEKDGGKVCRRVVWVLYGANGQTFKTAGRQASLVPGLRRGLDRNRGSIISSPRWQSAGTLWNCNNAIKDTGAIQPKPTVWCAPHLPHRKKCMMSAGLGSFQSWSSA